MDIEHNIWAMKRVNFIVKTLGEYYFKNKTVLELGSLNGFIGNEFYKLGCTVTCVEGRISNLNIIEKDYPHLKCIHTDLDKPKWLFDDSYDIILHMGLLYHQSNPEWLLEECQKRCDILVLESEVEDSESMTSVFGEPRKHLISQGLNAECITSAKWIESKLKTYTRFDSEELNYNYHQYDWKENNDDTYKFGRRRFWIVNC